MQFTRAQIIMISVVLTLFVIFIGIFTGIIPGARQNGGKLPEVQLTAWGIEEARYFDKSFIGYRELHPNVSIHYEQIDPANYETTLINALAAGKGPDVLMFHSSWLPKHYDKITPVDTASLTLTQFQSLFPKVVEQDFAPDGLVYALPLSVDTLALFYNEDIFDNSAIALPPKDWLEFQNLILKLRQTDTSGAITRAAAAIGGSTNTINTASDMLSLLMLQAGTQMTDDKFTQATFAEQVNGLYPGLDAFNFYTKFSNPKNTYYTWNDLLGDARDSFAQGKTAMMFSYAREKSNLKEKNPVLRFKASAMPQPNINSTAVNFADYWGLAVSNKSIASTWAWDFILYATTNEATAENFVIENHTPPALRSLIQKYTNDPELGVFAQQALTARSWPRIDNTVITSVFSQMIQAITNNQLDARTALDQAEKQITDIIKTRR